MVPNSVSYCRAKPFKVLAAAPRPREKGRFTGCSTEFGLRVDHWKLRYLFLLLVDNKFENESDGKHQGQTPLQCLLQ